MQGIVTDLAALVGGVKGNGQNGNGKASRLSVALAADTGGHKAVAGAEQPNEKKTTEAARAAIPFDGQEDAFEDF